MDEQTPSSDSQNDPWIALGEDAANEDLLVGNRAGLLCLREAIDGAIDKGEYFIPGEVGICGVRMVNRKPGSWASPHPFRDKVYGFGCMLIALFCGGVFLFGCAELIRMLF